MDSEDSKGRGDAATMAFHALITELRGLSEQIKTLNQNIQELTVWCDNFWGLIEDTASMAMSKKKKAVTWADIGWLLMQMADDGKEPPEPPAIQNLFEREE